MTNRRYTMVEACEQTGVERGFVVHCLRARWVSPAFPEETELDGEFGANEFDGEFGANEFDDQDLARIRLIATLQRDLGVNDEAVPVILHLLDQLYSEQAG